MEIRMNGNSITINGKGFSGRSVSILNGDVIVDGIKCDHMEEKVINVSVSGNVERIENANGTVTANNVGNVQTKSGDVRCGDIAGNVSTMSGDVIAGKIGGNVSTMSGDISCR